MTVHFFQLNKKNTQKTKPYKENGSSKATCYCMECDRS